MSAERPPSPVDLELGLRTIRPEDLNPCQEACWTVGARVRTSRSAHEDLSEEQTGVHLRSLGLTEEGVDYTIGAIHAQPGRKVGSAYLGNRTGELHSYVQGGFHQGDSAARIQFESGGEHDFAICISADPSTLLLIDQPSTISSTRPDALGRPRAHSYTPDFLVVSTQRVTVYEVKPLESLLKLLKQRPDLWIFQDGSFTFLPAHEHFRSLGMFHQVVPSETISWVYAENLRILSAVSINAPADQDPRLVSKIVRLVERSQPTSLGALVDQLGLHSGVPVIKALIEGKIFVDLQRCSLWHPSNTVICSSEVKARQVAIAVEQLEAEREEGRHDPWATCHPRHLALVGQRLAIVRGMDVGAFPAGGRTGERTAQRHRKAYREYGIAGLLPKWENCGRPPRFTEEDRDLAMHRIETDRSSSNHDTVQQSYSRYLLDVAHASRDGRKINVIGESLYYELWAARRHNRSDALGVGGRRRANSDAGYGDPSHQKPLCTLPSQVAHCDHCSLPVLCKESEGSPQFSSLVCHNTTEVLAWILRFAPPSIDTLSLLLRKCIRRHGFLPASIYHDRGSDFRSVDFAVGLAELGVNMYFRAAADGRKGSEIERLHSTIESTAIRGADGYKPPVRTLRGTSSSHQPHNLPRRDAAVLSQEIGIAIDMLNDGSAYEGGDDLVGKRLQSEALYGPQGVPCSMNFDTYVRTSRFIKKIAGKTDPRGAIRWKDRRYYSPVLLGRSLHVAALHPRLDPESAQTIIYFWLDRRWHIAICRERLLSSGRTLESILLEAAHDCEKRKDDACLRPLHTAIELFRRQTSIHGSTQSEWIDLPLQEDAPTDAQSLSGRSRCQGLSEGSDPPLGGPSSVTNDPSLETARDCDLSSSDDDEWDSISPSDLFGSEDRQ